MHLRINRATEQHLAIHRLYDQREQELGENADPKWTATLDMLEKVGAESVAEITGCNARKIKETLRMRHDNLNLSGDTLLRADPDGHSGLTMDRFVEVLSEFKTRLPST